MLVDCWVMNLVCSAVTTEQECRVSWAVNQTFPNGFTNCCLPLHNPKLLAAVSWTLPCTTAIFIKIKKTYPPPPNPHPGNDARGGMLQSWRLCISVLASGFCPDSISWTAQPFVTKLGMVLYYHELECHAEKLVCCLLPRISSLFISTLLVHSHAFFPKPLLIFSCVGCS